MVDGTNGFHKQMDFSLPEAIRVDQQRLLPSSKAMAEAQAPHPLFLPEGQEDSSRFLKQVAKCSEGLDNSAELRAGLEQSISYYRNLNEAGQLKLAEALQQLGALHHKEGTRQKALSCYEESLSLLRQLPADDAAAPMDRALKQTGSIHYEMQRLPEAFHYFEKALDIATKSACPPSDSEKLEAAAIATLSAAIQMEIAIEGQAKATGQQASHFIALAEKFMEGLNEEGRLVKKRMEELKYMNRVLKGMLQVDG